MTRSTITTTLPTTPTTPTTKEEDWQSQQQWTQAERILRSSEGSGGVFFLELEGGKRTVIKPCPEPALELFAGRFLEAQGIRVPRARLVEYANDEWKKLRECCLRLGASTSFPIKVEREMQRPFFLVMEYIQGIDLCFYIDSARTLSSKQLEDLGILIAGDIFLNNWDRLPFVWKNNGNPYNILISDEDNSQVIAIDQKSTTLIDKGEDRYVAAVEEFLAALASDVEKETPQTAKTRLALITPCGKEIISEKDVAELQKAIARGIRNIGKMDLEDIKTLRDEISAMAHRDWDNVWLKAVEKIRLPFF